MGCVRPVGRPTGPILRGKNFNVGHYTQIFQQKSCIPAMLIGTICFYHYIPISLTLSLTLPGGTRSAQSKISWLHFLAHFSTDQDETPCDVEAI